MCFEQKCNIIDAIRFEYFDEVEFSAVVRPLNSKQISKDQKNMKLKTFTKLDHQAKSDYL